MNISHNNSNHLIVPDVLQSHVDQKPHKLACIFQPYGLDSAAKLTYGELNQRILERSHLFIKLGLQESPVALIYPSGLDFVINFLACLFSGVVSIPLNLPRNPQQLKSIVSILDHASVRSILTTSSTKVKLKQQMQNFPELAGRRWFWIDEQNPGLENISLPYISPDKVAFIQYTSGSTSAPKGVMVSHRNIMENLRAIQEFYNYSDHLIGGGWLPHFHDMGLIGQMLQPLFSGGTYVFMPPLTFVQRPIRWLELISHYRFHSTASPNFGYKHCVKNIKSDVDLSHLDLSSWQVALNGSEPIDADTMNSFSAKFKEYGFNPKAFAPTYGLAECTLFVSGTPPFSGVKTLTLNKNEYHNGRIETDSHGKVVVSCGMISSRFRVKIVNPTSGKLCTNEEIGEVCVSGASVTQGYFNNSELTKESFYAALQEADGYDFLRTGDTGFIHEDMLYITGRIKDLITINGRNIYPYDIELTCSDHPLAVGNNSAVVFTIAENKTEKIIAVVEIQKKYLHQGNSDKVVDELRESIMNMHSIIVNHIILVNPGTIPKTTSGKIKRNHCKDIFFANSMSTNLDIMSRDILLDKLCNYLSVKISIFSYIEHSNVSFSSLGLDSIGHIEMTSVIEDYLQTKVEPTLAFDYPTVNALVDFLEENFINPSKTNSQESIS